MTSYKTDCESIKHLIPLYVKGILSDLQKDEFERVLIDCPELKDEIEKWKKINNAYEALESTLPQPSTNVYPKITKRIKEANRFSFLQSLMPSAKFSLAFIATQFVIIIALGVYIINLKHEYRTLSVPSVTTDKSIRINVVFKENASEVEIRNLLLQINARIVEGPCSSGLYIIGINSQEELGHALMTLRKNRIVVMAERAY